MVRQHSKDGLAIIPVDGLLSHHHTGGGMEPAVSSMWITIIRFMWSSHLSRAILRAAHMCFLM